MRTSTAPTTRPAMPSRDRGLVMRATTPVRLTLAALLVLGTAGAASAQLKLGGMNLEGEIESGLRFNVDDPERRRTQKFEEYRDMGEGLQLEGLRLRLFRPDESYAVEFGGSKWGREDQEFSLGVGRLGLWEFRFDWDQTPHVFSTDARMLARETSPGVFRLPAGGARATTSWRCCSRSTTRSTTSGCAAPTRARTGRSSSATRSRSSRTRWRASPRATRPPPPTRRSPPARASRAR